MLVVQGGSWPERRVVRTGLSPMNPKVFICDPTHPHYGESGVLTGKIITMRFGDQTQMAEVKLDACKHGTDGCFVTKGQVDAERRG